MISRVFKSRKRDPFNGLANDWQSKRINILTVKGGEPLQRRRSVDPALDHPDVVDVGLGGLPE